MSIFKKLFKIEKRDGASSEEFTSLTGVGLSFLTNKESKIDSISLSAVFAAIEIISNSIAEIPIDVKTMKENKETVVTDHPLYAMFNAGIQTKFMLMKMLIVDMLIEGNGFAYIERDNNGKPVSLIYCPRKSVTINYNENTRKLYYQCPKIQKGYIEPINMIHLVKNTEDGIKGRGILSYAHCTLELAKSTEEAAHGYFEGKCHVAGILSTDVQRLTQQQRNDIRTAWSEAHGKNGSGMAVLEAGMKYEPVSSNSKDAQLLETRLFNLQDIARFFNISPVLLGDLTHSSYSTIEASLLEFVTHTLYPYITLIENEFTRKLILPSEKSLYIDLDDDYIIKSDKSSQAEYLTKLTSNGIITINEARKHLGLNPIEGGDSLHIPYTNIGQNTITGQNKINTSEKEEDE